jgi:CRISPR/Cas system CSM-associated protein Csm3 (group 7 of RAMP superfamily)
MHVSIRVTARFETPFHIGGGVTGESATIKPLLKDGLGRPYLPGSTLKGVLRHEAERIVRALAGENAACRAPRAETMCPQWHSSVIGCVDAQERTFCPVCCTFGSPASASPFHFSDLRADMTDAEAVEPTTLRYGVGVSRYRGAAAENLLYTTEVVSAAPMIPFSGAIEGKVPGAEGNSPLALLLAAIGALRMVGGGRSRGLGWLRLEVTDPPLTPAQVREELKRWLSIQD